jgi:excisionase family DNA binding protein
MLTVADVADRLNISKQVVYALVEAGDLPVHRFGLGRGTIRVSDEDLRSFVAASRVEKKTEEPRRAPRLKLKHIRV